jgi:hypothetical protein
LIERKKNGVERTEKLKSGERRSKVEKTQKISQDSNLETLIE